MTQADEPKFWGIAIGGNKAAGKDLVLAYLLGLAPAARVVRCKTPIVAAYERIVGHPYVKARDDAELMALSASTIRARNDCIVGDWLRATIPPLLAEPSVPLIIIPDMRFRAENDALVRDLGFLSVRVWASEETRAARILGRDGHLRNFLPADATERDVDALAYHQTIDNNRDDGGRHASAELEALLSRYRGQLAGGAQIARAGAGTSLIENRAKVRT